MSYRLRVNPIACDAHGMCAELLPERVALDEWGYPIVDDTPLEPSLLETARRATQACPTFALLLERGSASWRWSSGGEVGASRRSEDRA